VKTGVQSIHKLLKVLVSDACAEPDPGVGGMTENRILRLYFLPFDFFALSGFI
jgi:hypothetical protein